MPSRSGPPAAVPPRAHAPTAPVTVLRPREDRALADRMALSAATGRGARLATRDVRAWLDERRRAGVFQVERVPFAALGEWRSERGTGNLVHRSGRFFTVEGLRVAAEHGAPQGYGPRRGPRREWQQPVIHQPEVGILGILAKEFDGVLHFLMQAKMEPGNAGLLQLSPTVQATRSNYTGAHRGRDVRLIDRFLRPGRAHARLPDHGHGHGRDRVLVDVLHSEQGTWFYRKSNRNMIVETADEIPAADDFRWLTLGQIAVLLHEDDLVNMNARSVLSCVPHPDPAPGALLSDTQLLSWFTGERSRLGVRAQRVPLASVRGWRHGPEAIEREDGRWFRVVAVSVRAGSREVVRWDQPLIEPVGLGLAAFLVHEFDGVPHVLVHARAEGGFLDTVELGPTVQCVPEECERVPEAERPPFLGTVLSALLGDPPSRVRYQAVHSEEGGRLLNARCRYLLVEAEAGTGTGAGAGAEAGAGTGTAAGAGAGAESEAGAGAGAESEAAPFDPPPGFAWVTPAQLRSLTRHGHYLTVEARTLLACLNAVGAGPRPVLREGV